MVCDKSNWRFGDMLFKNIIIDILDFLEFYGDLKTFKTKLFLFQDTVPDRIVKIFRIFWDNVRYETYTLH